MSQGTVSTEAIDPAAPAGTASNRLHDIRERLRERAGTVALGEIVDWLGQAGIGLALLLLTLPALIPVPGPFGAIFGSIIAILGLQVLFGASRLKLPGFIRRWQVPRAVIGRMLDRGTPILNRFEQKLKPRRMLPLTSKFARTVLALPLLVAAVTLALPIPTANLLPAGSLIAFGLGLIARDGAAILVGLGLSVAGVAWGATVVLIGAQILAWIGHALHVN